MLSIAFLLNLLLLGPISAFDECSDEILMSYFPKVFVQETLNKFQVAQDHREEIVQDLQERDKEIIRQVEEKAEQLSPNPLRDPRERHVAVRIFRETLTDNFTSVMNQHGIVDAAKIQAMLDDIQRQKAQVFAKCMEKRYAEDESNAPYEDDQEEFEFE